MIKLSPSVIYVDEVATVQTSYLQLFQFHLCFFDVSHVDDSRPISPFS